MIWLLKWVPLSSEKICSWSNFTDQCSRVKEGVIAKYAYQCECKPKYCMKKVTLAKYKPIKFPKWEVYEKIFKMPAEIQKRMQIPYQHFVEKCYLSSRGDCNAARIQVPCPHEWPFIPACWTFNSILYNPEEKPIVVDDISSLDLTLNVMEDKSYPEHQPTAHISIHDVRQVLNPFTHGYRLYNKMFNTFFVKRSVYYRLPFPYDTNCTDYIQLWKSKNGTGPTNQKDCYLECEKNVSIKSLGCISYKLSVPGEGKRCHELLTNAMNTEIDKCKKTVCMPACYEVLFEVIPMRINVADQVYCAQPHIMEQIGKAEALVKLYDLDTVVYTSRPMFEEIELFCYLGKYMTVWLGLSLIALLDFAETILCIIVRSFLNICTQSKLNTVSKI